MAKSNASSALEVHHYYYIRDHRSGDIIGVLSSQVFISPGENQHTQIGMLRFEVISYSEYLTALAFEIPGFRIEGKDVILDGHLAGVSLTPDLNIDKEE